jgi:glycosyltransferase involved in cell wall biosynthesis
LEALASGTPIVGFDAGGIPDFVRPHETGLLAPLRDPHGLTDAPGLGQQIRYLARHRDEAVRLGERAREVALREYHEEREANDYIQLYKKLQAG